MAEETVKTETIQAVDRALQILETIGRVNSMSLAELNREIKVNKASLSRLVYTLVQNGYLAKNEKSGEFSLTLKTYEVGLNAVQNLDKLSLIKSTLVDLNSRCGRIAQFSVEDNNQLLCLQSIGKEAMSFSVYTSVGHRSPLYSTSAGKALLSAYSNGEIIEKSDNEFFLMKEGFTQPVLQSHICSLKRASFGDSNKIYMCESSLKVINFDKIPNPYVFV